MFIAKKKYKKRISKAVDDGFNLGKLYMATKIHKEIMEGTTLNGITRLCQHAIDRYKEKTDS